VSVAEPENQAPTKPTITMSSTATQGGAVSVTVKVGIDPDGDQVKVHCSTGSDGSSNYTDASPYQSSFGAGGRNITLSPALIFSEAGTQTLYCTTFDEDGKYDFR